MTRHELKTRDGQNEAVVGWDKPMQTFWAQIANGKLEDIDFENEPLVWVGADRVGEIETVAELEALVGSYIDITYELATQLKNDQEQGRYGPAEPPASPTIQALVIDPDGKCELTRLPVDGPQSLPSRQAIVGGYIEALSFDKPGTQSYDAHLWINENGKYDIGPIGYNGLATDLVRHVIGFGDWICGTAIVCGEGRMGEDGDVPDWVVSTVRAYPDCEWTGPEPSQDRGLS